MNQGGIANRGDYSFVTCRGSTYPGGGIGRAARDGGQAGPSEPPDRLGGDP
jgi:hypothetical protein